MKENLELVDFNNVAPGMTAICGDKKFPVLVHGVDNWSIRIGNMYFYKGNKPVIDALGIQFFKEKVIPPVVIHGTIIDVDLDSCTLLVNTSHTPREFRRGMNVRVEEKKLINKPLVEPENAPVNLPFDSSSKTIACYTMTYIDSIKLYVDSLMTYELDRDLAIYVMGWKLVHDNEWVDKNGYRFFECDWCPSHSPYLSKKVTDKIESVVGNKEAWMKHLPPDFSSNSYENKQIAYHESKAALIAYFENQKLFQISHSRSIVSMKVGKNMIAALDNMKSALTYLEQTCVFLLEEMKEADEVKDFQRANICDDKASDIESMFYILKDKAEVTENQIKMLNNRKP